MPNVSSSKPSRPLSIGRFELLAYLSLFLFACTVVVAGVLDWDSFVEDWALSDTAAVVSVISALVKPGLIFATARRRQNWARWTYSALVALDAVMELTPPYDDVPIVLTLAALFVVAEVAAVYFAFSRESAIWFKPPGAAPDRTLAEP